MISESQSAHRSMLVTSHILNPLLSRFGIVPHKDDVRKIAHTTEFCVLALIASIGKKPIRSIKTGFTLAFLDVSNRTKQDDGL